MAAKSKRTEYLKAWRAANLDKVRALAERRRSDPQTRARDAQTKKRWNEENRERVRDLRRTWRDENRERKALLDQKSYARNREQILFRNRQRTIVDPYYRRPSVLRLYGLTSDSYRAMLVAQEFCCAICSEPFAGKRSRQIHLDHDHETKRARGVLCAACNLVLGKVRDMPSTLRKAAEYLERNKMLSFDPRAEKVARVKKTK